MAYLIDTDVFIESKDRYYGFDICPGFWDWLIRENAAGRVFSIEKVSGELRAVDDALAAWAVARGEKFFVPPDATVLPALATVSDWTKRQGYNEAAITPFLEKADLYVVAHALAHGWVVVTQEKPDNSVRKVKIPNVCIGVGVRCITQFEMLRECRAKFVLAG
jgi:hypothetical protein